MSQIAGKVEKLNIPFVILTRIFFWKEPLRSWWTGTLWEDYDHDDAEGTKTDSGLPVKTMSDDSTAANEGKMVCFAALWSH
jgi:hypothetical protein